MAIDFPSAPAPNDTYTYNSRTWKYNGSAWESVTTTLGPAGPTGPTGATGPVGYGYATVLTQSGTSYTLVSTDVNDLIKFTSATAVTVTIPPASTGGWSAGNSIDILQMGLGQVTVAAGVGVTIRTTGLLKTRDQYSAITIVCVDTDEWLLQGDTAVV